MARTHFTPQKIVNRWSIAFVGVGTLLMFLAIPRGNAQTAGTGSIQGVVTDNTGAVIQNASVTLANTATGVNRSAVTDSSGIYSFPNIPIGTYAVDVVTTGFEHYKQVNIVLEVGSSIAVNVKMTVGSTVQQIEVQANALALQTEDPSFKQTIDQQTATELPLNGRQVTSLITLSGGSVKAYNGNDLQGSKAFYSSVVVSVAGGQGNATDYELDGADNNDYMTNISLPFPFPDAVAQFSVETTAMGAQGGGLHPGGVVDVVTRSGTSQWHGAAFEFIRNNYIDATNFFSTSKDTLHQNQYGGTVGGPIIRNKLFAFAGYQRTGSEQAQALTKAFVPTTANLNGDFSTTDGATCESSGKAVQLVDPLTGALLTNNQGVNTAKYSNAAKALLKYFPATTDQNCGEVSYAIPLNTRENQFITRLDWSINQKHSLYARYYVDGYQQPAFFSPTNVLVTTQAGQVERAQGLTFAETYIATPHLVNTFHATGSIRSINRGPVTPGINPATLGINMNADSPVGIQLTATNKWAAYCNKCSLSFFNVNTFSYTDDVNWVHGKHQVAFGGGFVRTQLNSTAVYEGNGVFTFSGIYSKTGPAGISAGGTGEDANLDFLEGALNTYVQSNNENNTARQSIPSLYIQDTYHATNKLVVAAGVRWDPEFFPGDKFGRGLRFNMTGFEGGVISTVYPNAPAGAQFYGDAGIPKSFTTNSPWQFSPRIGITYDPFANGKTVFRAGGGLVYDTPNLYTENHVVQDPPFSETISNTPVGQPMSFDAPWSNGAVTTDPFPLTATGKASIFPPGNAFITMTPNFHPPYSVQWTASIQQEFGRGWQFQIDYMGNQTSFGVYPQLLNPAVYIPGTWGAGGTGCAGIVTTGPDAVKPGAAGTPCSTTSNYLSRYKLTTVSPTLGPSYLGGNSGLYSINTGVSSNYNGLVLTLQHRMSSHFVLLSNYTWSHCIDVLDAPGDASNQDVAQNSNDENADRGNCGYDYRHVFNTTVVADSHFSSLRGWKGQLVNGWEIAPLVVVQDGVPFTVTSGQDNSLTDALEDRPNLTNPSAVYTHAKILSGKSTNAKYISAAAFTQNAPGTFGTASRDEFRGPKFLQADCSLDRNIALHEGLAMTLRLDAFNVLNHPDFLPPGSGSDEGQTTPLTASTFGQITTVPTSTGAAPAGYGARVFQGSVKFTF